MKAKTIWLLVAILVGLTSVGYAQVKDYPKKPIQIIVGHPPGGGIDTFYRLLAEQVSKTWNVPVNLVNKPAASGAIAGSEVANAEKDGYTLFAILINQLASLSVGNPKSPVHMLHDFDPIEVHTYAAQVMLVKADSKFKSFDDLVDYSRKKPGEVLCAVPQVGSSMHLVALLLNRQAKLNMTLVHLDGPPEIATGILGGHFDVGFLNDVVAKPHVTAGKLKAIVSDIKSYLGVPTFAEKGYPQIDLPTVMGLLGPKGLPPAIIKTWEDTLKTILKEPAFIASMNKLSYNINMVMGAENLSKRLKEEMDKCARFTPEELGWKK
jgi:tripartite-type tricarboxylate transporter receptor subunit TctC